MVTAPDIPGHGVGGILGAGGFATVYRCWQLGEHTGQPVRHGRALRLRARLDHLGARRADGLPRGADPAFGIRTRSAGCPATLRVAAARCPASPECFGGLVVSAGSASAETVDCGRAHDWETFAIAILPATVRTFDYRTVAADPAVRRTCSRAVMLASRQGRARRLPAPDWRADVLPPSQAAFGSGSRVYRCLANEIGHEPHVSQFGR